MKNLLTLFSLFFCVIICEAQDKLITQDGDVKMVYNVEVSSNKIFYTLENKPNAAIQQIAKKEVLMIKHSDGTKELFNTGEDASTPKTETPQKMKVAEAQSDRHAIMLKNEDFVPVKYIDDVQKAKGKKANLYYVLYQIKNGSIIEDDNVVASFKVIGYDQDLSKKDLTMVPNEDITIPRWNYSLKVMLQNKTKKTLYIDLGNTFISRGGEATAYYIPSATSTGTETTTGGSVNLGSIGSALNIGGAAGTIMNGVNVGGSSTGISTTTTYSQRVIAIPPMSQKTLESKILFPAGSEPLYKDFIKNKTLKTIMGKETPVVYTTLANENLNEGESVVFDENSSPINFYSYITYSFDENCNETSYLQANMYVKQILGFRYNALLGIYSKNYDKFLSPDWKNRTFFMLAHLY